MDLGATICTPQRPTCLVCPLSELCQGLAAGIQESLPVLDAAPVTPHYTVTAAIIDRGSRVLIARRPSKGLLGGLWEFPGGKLEAGETLADGLKREIREELAVDIDVGEPFGIYKHAFTHFKITLHAYKCTLAQGEPQALEASAIVWVGINELNNYPMGKVDRLIANNLRKEAGVNS
jgi:A/G-specific adenine glycosylase